MRQQGRAGSGTDRARATVVVMWGGRTWSTGRMRARICFARAARRRVTAARAGQAPFAPLSETRSRACRRRVLSNPRRFESALFGIHLNLNLNEFESARFRIR